MTADSFRQFCTDVGIPMNLNTDMAISFEGRHIVYQDVVRNIRLITLTQRQRIN